MPRLLRFRANARQAMQVFDVFAPQHMHQLLRGHDSQKSTIRVHDRHFRDLVMQRQTGDEFLIVADLSFDGRRQHDLAQADRRFRSQQVDERHDAHQMPLGIQHINRLNRFKGDFTQPSQQRLNGVGCGSCRYRRVQSSRRCVRHEQRWTRSMTGDGRPRRIRRMLRSTHRETTSTTTARPHPGDSTSPATRRRRGTTCDRPAPTRDRI
ncbi:MAG: hypothetical protein FD138_1967 [Planctomycetota bacterium]|nr:MAG: hypothetical protein FD138_1967 [Planctomycetota bacterium]